MVTRLVLIRHAHAASNPGGSEPLLTGVTDVPLTPRGREEAHLLQQRIRRDPPFAAIYSSPLWRALETACALADDGAGPLYVCRDLREIDCGELDGLPLREVARQYPAIWEANLRQDDDTFRWPGGESYRELRGRCLRAVRTIARHHRGERTALVTHAGVISQIIGALTRTNPARWEDHRPANAAISEIDWGYGTGTLVTFDDRAHLAALAGNGG